MEDVFFFIFQHGVVKMSPYHETSSGLFFHLFSAGLSRPLYKGLQME